MIHQQLTYRTMSAPKPTMQQFLKWLDRLNEVIEKTPEYNLSNVEIAKKLDISERDLFRKVKKASGLSPQKYIRQYRLAKAHKWLIKGKYKTVKEVSQAIGYANVSYFILQFEKEFGKKPLQVLKEQGWR